MTARPALAALASCAVLVAWAANAPAKCPDADTLVVGDGCKKFGEDGGGLLSGWSSQLPPIVATLSLRSISYSPSSRDSFDGNVETSPLAYKFGGNAFGAPIRTYGIEMGLFWYPTPFTYLGPALGLGEGKYAGGPFTADALTIEPRDSLNATTTTFGGVAGLRLPLGSVSLRGELFAGGDWLSIDQYASNATNRLTATSSATVLLIEPRAALDLWATPFLTVSLFGAMPAFDPRATDAGLVLSGHLRAFDGRYGLF
ncbi:MAG TPA: hypothetical protein VIF09_24880 [Polyangiaceae bacterium]